MFPPHDIEVHISQLRYSSGVSSLDPFRDSWDWQSAGAGILAGYRVGGVRRFSQDTD